MKKALIALSFIFLISTSAQAFNFRSYLPTTKLTAEQTAKVDGKASILTDNYGSRLGVSIYNGSAYAITGVTVAVTCKKKDAEEKNAEEKNQEFAWLDSVDFSGLGTKLYRIDIKGDPINKLEIGNTTFRIDPCAEEEDFSWSFHEIRGMKI